MNISLIVALTNDCIIGKLNTIPWVLPHDMFWFRYHTLNKIVIMGRKTFESIGRKPLLNRFNIVLSRSIIQNQYFPNLVFVSTPEEALWLSNTMCKNFSDEIIVIGGAQIYDMFLSYVNRLYMTYIDIPLSGDTLFPIYREREWCLVFSKSYFFQYGYGYCFKIFNRKLKYYNL